jgi:DNA invertase Pin-like site-specific DNA recombinase
MKCAIYARFSTDNQNEESIESQVETCKECIKREGWNLAPDHIYPDYAISGSTVNRPALQNLLAAACKKPRPFDKVVVFSKSRLSRKALHELQITADLEKYGIEVVSVTEPIHQLTGSGRVAMDGAIRMVNEVFLVQVSEHVRRGQDRVAQQGYKTTWPPYGYKKEYVPDAAGTIDNRTGQPRLRLQWVVDEEKAEVVRWLFNEYLQGNGFKKLASKLNEKGVRAPRSDSWAPSAIREMLRNHSYLGWYCLGKTSQIRGPDGQKRHIDNPVDQWRISKNVHEPIVTEDLFNRVQKRMAKVAKKYKKHISHTRAEHSNYLLTGLIKCSVCEANFTVQSTKAKAGEPPRYWHYVCGYRRNRGTSVCSNSNRINMHVLDKAVLEATEQKLMDPEMIHNVAKQAERILDRARVDAYEAEGLEQEKRKLEKEIERFTRALATADQAPDAAELYTEQIQERKERLKEINRILDRPKRAQKKVERLLLPFFGDQKVAIKYAKKKEKSLKDWYRYLQEELGGWVDALHDRSPIAVRDELQKHIREITVHEDGKIVIHGTYKGILAEAGLIEAGDLGEIEIRPEKRRKTKKKAPRQKSKGYTRKNGVPKGI